MKVTRECKSDKTMFKLDFGDGGPPGGMVFPSSVMECDYLITVKEVNVEKLILLPVNFIEGLEEASLIETVISVYDNIIEMGEKGSIILRVFNIYGNLYKGHTSSLFFKGFVLDVSKAQEESISYLLMKYDGLLIAEQHGFI